MSAHLLIRKYYQCFNERRFADAADLFSNDAVVDRPPFGSAKTGGEAYVLFADLWVKAFPDASIRIDHVEQRGDTICEIDLVASGTHTADLDLPGHGKIKANGRSVTLWLGEILEIRGNKITYASLTFDTLDLVRQMTRKT